MNILGLNAYHGDSSACLLVDGRLVAAAEEERFRRVKHWSGFPSKAIRYCLQEGDLRIGDIDRIAVNRRPKAHALRKIAFALLNRPSSALIRDRTRNLIRWISIEEDVQRAFPDERVKARLDYIEHHEAHLASTHWVSGMDDTVAVSVDAMGDFASTAWGLGSPSSLRVDGRVFFPHSLGIFYTTLTQYLGFPQFGDEYKVMGLAPYGRPVFLEQMRRIVQLRDDGTFNLDLRLFHHHRKFIDRQWVNCAPTDGSLVTEELEAMLGPARRSNEPLGERHKDLARSVQAMYEEAFFHLLNALHRRYGLDCLALAGGCGMNSVANGKIYKNTPFKRLYVQSAAGDAGGAIGAALAVWHSKLKNGSRIRMDHSYWGPQFPDSYISRMLEDRRAAIRHANVALQIKADEATLCAEAAQAIADGKVVGWFQDRMEWGPRALGNRSILGDPRRADMKDILNLKIKRRESFRPFAPSILREAVSEWFETDDDVPFMMQVYQIKEDKRNLIPAVTHVDGSGRLQTVVRESNPRYYSLLQAFNRLTGVPLVLNTSFNENEPVVCRPEEALDCFLRTRMDVLVLGNYFLERTSQCESAEQIAADAKFE